MNDSSSRKSQKYDDRFTDILGELTNPRSSRQIHSANQCSKQTDRSSSDRLVGEEKDHSVISSVDKMGKLSNDDICERSSGAGHTDLGSPKRQSKSNCDKSVLEARNSQDMNVEFTVTLNLEDEDSLEIRDMTSELPRGGNYVKSKKDVEEEDSSTDNSTEISDIKELDSVDGLFNHKDKNSKKSEKHSEKKDKDSKKRRFRKMIGRPLRRSQSAGCESDLQVPEHALFLGEKFDEVCHYENLPMQ